MCASPMKKKVVVCCLLLLVVVCLFIGWFWLFGGLFGWLSVRAFVFGCLVGWLLVCC